MADRLIVNRCVPEVADVRTRRCGVRGRSRRPGFTLIEVMIALVIIGLAGLGLASFSMQSYRAVQNLTIRATAENLAEVTLEELSSMAGSVLHSMTHSPGYFSINFPENGYIQLLPYTDTVPDPELDPEALKVVEADDPTFDFSVTKKFPPAPLGTYEYHVLCNGQLLLGTYDSFFPDTTTPGTVESLGGSGAVVMSDGSDLFMSPSSWSLVVTRTGPSANDYNTLYSFSQVQGCLPSNDPSNYSVYKYELGSGIYLEPFNNGAHEKPGWDEVGGGTAGLLVFASTAPHLYREVTITDATTDTTTPSSDRMYQISVRVIWTFGGVRQLVEVTGAKVDLR